MNAAPWAPMTAPPLPLRNDMERDTCSHGYPAEDCTGTEWHEAPDGHLSGPVTVTLGHETVTRHVTLAP